jgi:lysophospholipase L1-like esterase
MKKHYSSLPSFLVFLLLTGLLAACNPKIQQTRESKFNRVQNIPPNIEKWERDMLAFEAQDKVEKPGKNAVLFVGSSSIVGWKSLATDFPDVEVVNRGFGGSQTDEVHYYAYRIIYPYKPKQVVIYVGDNDLSAGKSSETVYQDLKDLFDDIRYQLPKTKITYISIKPSPSRWHLMDAFALTNGRVKEYLDSIGNASYVDIVQPMLMPNGKANPEYFLSDSLHMTPKGYQVWAEALRPHL